MLVVKIGGGDGLDLQEIAEDIVAQGRPSIVIHGANKLRDRVATALGHPPRVVESVSGQTSVLSDEHALDALLASYAGIRNKRLVEALRKAGADAIGLTGLDGGLVTGEVNPGIRTMQGGKKVLLRDLSGKPQAVNRDLIEALIQRGLTPVLTVPIGAPDGTALNSENDDILTAVACALLPDAVVSLIEAPGLLSDREDPESLVPEVAACDLESWEARVEGRMRRKIRALRRLFDELGEAAPSVHLADGRSARPVSAALSGAGTRILWPTKGGGIEGDRPLLGKTLGPAEGSQGRANRPVQPGGADASTTHLLDVYGSRGITLVRGEGATVWDEEGRSYVDCVGGHGSLALGHRHPALLAALRTQSDLLWMVPGSFQSPARSDLVRALHGVLPSSLDRTFLSNSGTESVEAALKFARLHTGRSGLVAAEGGFHGRTMGALSVTGEARHREGFGPLIPEVRRVPFNDPDALRECLDDSVAGLILEPVQGERGVYPASPEYLKAARAACDEVGALLIFDEVQTGFGRTGKLFAFEHSGVVPDILCLSKSIASGLPLGATVVRQDIRIPIGSHGSTFGGNPIACAVAAAGIAVLAEEGFLSHAEVKGRRLADRLGDPGLTLVKEVRQIGLMLGVQLRVRARPFVERLQASGVLVLPSGTRTIRLLPPLVISDEQVDQVADALIEVLTQDD